MKKTKKILLMSLVMFTLLFTGCASTDKQETGNEKEESTENRQLDSLAGKLADSDAREGKADIEALAAEHVFNVHWYTLDGDYSAGTAFLMDSDVHGEKLLVTAFHFLWPEDADTFTGSELPDYVLGGEIYHASTDKTTNASLKNCLVIEDADAVPAVDKDVAAFTIQGGDKLKTLPLATEAPEKGDKIYLLASLWDTEDIHENCVYEGEVSGIDGGAIYYSLEGKPGTAGASGAPLVNEYGEVVAIHMGSNPLNYVGHTTDSFLEQINRATVSDVTYPEILGEAGDEIQDIEFTEYLEFAREEKVSTMFYDVQIDSVTVTDTLQGEACLEGYQFVVVDISLWEADDAIEPVPMYYDDFALEWEEDYCYPLEAGWTEEQLPDEYIIEEEGTTGELIFLAPIDKENAIFSFVDYYSVGDSEEVNYGAYYEMIIPLENWTR